MKTISYLSHISLLLLLALLVPTGCTKDEDKEDDILTSKPGENDIIRLTRNATILLEQEDLVDLVPEETVIFHLLPCNDWRHKDSSTSGPYLKIMGEKDDDGNFNLHFPIGTECIPYIIMRSTDLKGREPHNLGLVVKLLDESTLYTNDTYDYTYELFGAGTAEAPYRICQLEDMKSINLVRDNGKPVTHAGKYFRLETNIFCNDDLNKAVNIEEGGIQPIGMTSEGSQTVITPFCGKFNGNNLTIKEMSLRANSVMDNLGVFTVIGDGAVIHNLNIDKMTISNANQNIGGLAGTMKGLSLVDHCQVNVNLSGCKSVGGFIGRMEGGTITNCKSTGEIKTNPMASGATYGFGGIVGCVYQAPTALVKIDKVENGASVDGTENVGGIVGFLAEISRFRLYFLQNNSSTAATISGLRSVGGLIGGCAGGLKMVNCKSSTRINPREINAVTKDIGGLIGAVSTESSLTLSGCTTKSPVTNETTIMGSYQVGGLIGTAIARDGINIENCQSAFNVGSNVKQAPNDNKGNFIGGLVGRATTSITFINSQCTASSVMSGSGTDVIGSYVGGLVGRCEGEVRIQNCSNNATITAITCAGGLVGNTEDVSISGSTNQASVNARDMHAGGLVGYARHCNISYCKLLDENKDGDLVTISSAWRAGGIIGLTGDLGGTITNCTIGGHINTPGTNMSNKCAGGIIGETATQANKKLEVHDVTFKGTVAAGQYAGGIVGYSSNTFFKNCQTESRDGKILVAKDGYAGGIAGYAQNSNFWNCTNKTHVAIGQGNNDNIGGIVGYNHNCALSGSINTANIGGTNSSQVGGICGYARYTENNGTYVDCINSGSVIGSDRVGGINGIFFALKTQLWKVSNSGAVKGNDEVGGVNGFQSGGYTIFASNTGTVNGNKKVGGINGKMNSNSGDSPDKGTDYQPIVDRSFNTGIIDGNSYVGGISGTFEYYSYAWVANSYNRGRVGHTGTGECAGIVGNVYNTAKAKIENCYSGTTERTGYGVVGHCLSNAQSEVAVFDTYYLTNSATSKDDHGFSKIVSQLDNQGSFHFDFNGVWTMRNGYPQLKDNLEK